MGIQQIGDGSCWIKFGCCAMSSCPMTLAIRSFEPMLDTAPIKKLAIKDGHKLLGLECA